LINDEKLEITKGNDCKLHISLSYLVLIIRLVDTFYNNLTTTYLLTKEHMSMFVVKFIVIQLKGQSRELSIATTRVMVKGDTFYNHH
jgi:hypothetical protein